MTTLLDEAEDFLTMDNTNKNKGVVEDIRELVESANEWMEDAQKAIDDKTTTESELRSLYVEGNDIPVEMNLLKLVEAEIKRRDWTSRANAYISKEPFQKAGSSTRFASGKFRPSERCCQRIRWQKTIA